MTDSPDFQYVYRTGDRALQPLLLLHGTGGNEHDLIALADRVAPGRTLLSPRGRVVENGMFRFFRRFAEAVLDEDDIRLRAAELKGFIAGKQQEHDLTPLIAIGFSNGANMAAALLALYPDLLAGAVLLRAMAPFKSMPQADLNNTPVLLTSGSQDVMIPTQDASRLASWLAASNCRLTHETWSAGHGLVQQDFMAMKSYLSERN